MKAAIDHGQGFLLQELILFGMYFYVKSNTTLKRAYWHMWSSYECLCFEKKFKMVQIVPYNVRSNFPRVVKILKIINKLMKNSRVEGYSSYYYYSAASLKLLLNLLNHNLVFIEAWLFF